MTAAAYPPLTPVVGIELARLLVSLQCAVAAVVDVGSREGVTYEGGRVLLQTPVHQKTRGGRIAHKAGKHLAQIAGEQRGYQPVGAIPAVRH